MVNDWPFTPEVETGGWQVEYENAGLGSYSIEAARPIGGADPTSEEIAANINLIAAAPRMYRALKRYIEEADDLKNLDEIEVEARDIIDWIDQRG